MLVLYNIYVCNSRFEKPMRAMYQISIGKCDIRKIGLSKAHPAEGNLVHSKGGRFWSVTLHVISRFVRSIAIQID